MGHRASRRVKERYRIANAALMEQIVNMHCEQTKVEELLRSVLGT